MLECLCEIGGHDVPINIGSTYKIQEEHYSRSIESGNISGCEDRSKYSW